eukprot:m51a1_g2122 hypothetical protein (82) ;mRNA; f:1668841-1669202
MPRIDLALVDKENVPPAHARRPAAAAAGYVRRPLQDITRLVVPGAGTVAARAVRVGPECPVVVRRQPGTAVARLSLSLRRL